jgi:hypothetical protein
MSLLSEMNPSSRSDSSPASPTYWKVIRADGKHYDHQWTLGLNVLADEFNDNAGDGCCAGRLYYCEQKDLIHWLFIGDYVQRVVEPMDDPEFRCITIGSNKKGANRLVLTDERYSLHDIATYHRLGIDLTKYTMDRASHNGHVAVLQWHLDRSKDSGLKLEYSEWATYDASANGHVAVLQWWLDRSKDNDSGLEFKYNKWAVNYVSNDGHSAVVQWWESSGLINGLSALAP